MGWMIAVAKRRTTLVGAGFVAISATIAANALFLQTGRHPAPFFHTGQQAEVGLEQPRPDAVVEAVQAALKEAGYDIGTVDGIAGDRTEAAIRSFETQAGRAATGRANPDLLAAILDAKPQEQTTAEASPMRTASLPMPAPEGSVPPPGAEGPSPEVVVIQQALAKAAYGPLSTDGVIGRQTREAIMRFQADHDIPVTGDITDALVVELRAAGALGGD